MPVETVIALAEQLDNAIVDAPDPRSLRPLTIDELMQRPSPAWIVRNVLLCNSLSVIFGASGSGKTFLMLDMAAAVARGEPWCGRRVRPGGVIYVAGEGHLTLRIAAYLAHHQITPADLSRLRVVASTVNILNDETGDLATLIAEIRKAAAALGGVALVVLDTLNAMMPGGDENASADMGKMIEAARRIMLALGCAVAYVHHSGKDESKGSRGHSSLRAAVDLEMQITSNGSERVAEVVKLRDGEPGQRFAFRLEPVDLGPDPDPEADAGERIGSCAVRMLGEAPAAPRAKASTKSINAKAQVALRALRDVISDHGEPLPETSIIPPGKRGVTLDQWRDRYHAVVTVDATDDGAEWRKRTESRRKAFERAREALLAAGEAGTVNNRWWLA